jgi:hypothetical protein
MRRRAISTCCLLTLACHKSSSSESEESSSSSSTSTSTSTTTSTESSSSSTTVMADSSSSSSESGPVELSISGVAQDFFAAAPIVHADISLLDEPGFDTVSAQGGQYTISGLMPNSFHRIRLKDNAMYWGAIVPATLETESLEDFDLSQVSVDVIDLQEGALQQQDPTVVVDETKAAFLVALNQNTATGATVILDPPPPMNTYYAPDANGQPVLNSDTIEWGIYPVAVIFNLEPADAGTYTLSVTHPERTCTVEDPEPPTFARHINLLYVDCPAP